MTLGLNVAPVTSRQKTKKTKDQAKLSTSVIQNWQARPPGRPQVKGVMTNKKLYSLSIVLTRDANKGDEIRTTDCVFRDLLIYRFERRKLK